MKEIHIQPTVLKGISTGVGGDTGEDVKEPGLHYYQCIH